ncbi:hypothetical protein MKW94_026942 [Papaver nudicaule]|uniref:RING-type domain-containing protein n=1 Tax=Papaver nudicaule TaxID=74823 RepID=A0AA42ARI3_PAPNU|nr:hypothetical protein [Papaver nudicaule]
MKAKKEEELLECPICWESFNLVENIPYILWCGHTLCETCILSLQWAAVRFPSLPIQLPLVVSCPWCQLLSFRVIWKGKLRFPSKNFLLLWLVENANGNQIRLCPSSCTDERVFQSSSNSTSLCQRSYSSSILNPQEPPSSSGTREGSSSSFMRSWRVCTSLPKSLALLLHITVKFPVIAVFMLIVFYIIPASAAILVGYLLITFLFALPSFLVLYFSYPILNWLVREIIAW